MLYLNSPKVVQIRFPFVILPEIIGYSPRKKNGSGVPAIHHPLRHVNAYSSNVTLIIYIGDLIHRAAVDPHSQVQLWMLTQPAANLQRTTDWHIHSGEAGQHYSIAR